MSLDGKIAPDGPPYFECDRCWIAWHAGPVNPAPAVCPNCGKPWSSVPTFPPAQRVEQSE